MPPHRFYYQHRCGGMGYKTLWARNKDLSVKEAADKFNKKYYLWTHRKLARFYYQHRCGGMGLKTPIVVLFGVGKLFAMAYATYRDQEAAIQCAAAYGQNGVMTS